MNIVSGQSTATPFWQTEDLRFGIVTSDVSTARECEVRLSCGNRVCVTVPAGVDLRLGGAVRVCRGAEGWSVEAVLD